MKNRLNIKQLDAILFDFDGVLTDDKVHVDQNGVESVTCSRKDGLAFEVLRATGLKLFIMSREKNPVVSIRAAKIKIEAVQSVLDKKSACVTLAKERGFDLKRTLYIGNDLNDFEAMCVCGYGACPADSHPKIIETADVVFKTKGGQGIVKELVEQVLELDALGYLSKKKKPDA